MNETKKFNFIEEIEEKEQNLNIIFKLKKEEIDKLMKAGHDFFLTPEQAVQMGIVDKIIGS